MASESASPATAPADAPAAAPDPLAGVPTLTTYAATDAAERVAALKLVADSVAQQRQAASRALLAHPASVGALGLLLAGAAQALLAWNREWLALRKELGGC